MTSNHISSEKQRPSGSEVSIPPASISLLSRILLWLGAGLGLLVYFLGIRRRVTYQGLSRAFPQLTPRARRRLGRRVYAQLGRSMVEILLARKMDDQTLNRLVCFEGFERYEAANALGRGVVVAIGHFGNWELLMRACARRGVRLAIISRTLPGVLNDFFFGLRKDTGVGIVRERDSIGDALQRLRSGETLGVPVDQNMRLKRGIFVPFFGTLACTTPTAAVLSLRTGAPLLAAFPVRQPDGSHRVLVEGPFAAPEGLRGRDAVLALTEEVTRAVERVVRAHPDHWYWLHRRWKTRPPSPP